MKNVFFPIFDSNKEITWTKEFLRILSFTHPEGPDGVHIYTMKDVKNLAHGKKRLCFRLVVGKRRAVHCRE